MVKKRTAPQVGILNPRADDGAGSDLTAGIPIARIVKIAVLYFIVLNS